MARRRMFSPLVTNSAKFLRMTKDAQNLYFHLCMNADDDGIVEAYTVMKQACVSDDSLDNLCSRGFAVVLNDDLVTYITDWRVHNKIRSDRKVESIYKNLLIQVVEGVEVLETRPRADRKRSFSRPTENEGVENGTTNGRHRLGKVRLGKVSKKPLSTTGRRRRCSDNPKETKIPFATVWEIYQRKEKTKDSKLKWDKLTRSTQELILEHLKRFVPATDGKSSTGRKIRPLFTTYLNSQRWLDSELPDGGTISGSAPLGNKPPRPGMVWTRNPDDFEGPRYSWHDESETMLDVKGDRVLLTGFYSI